jgi:hypothetical protein
VLAGLEEVPPAGQNLRRYLGYDLQYFAAIEPQKRLTRMSTWPSAAPSALRRVKEGRHSARYWASGTPRDEEMDLMGSNQEERNRVLGMPRGPDPYARQGEEQQRVLGVPVDWFGPVDRDWLESLIHPVRRYKQWVQNRRPDEDETERTG